MENKITENKLVMSKTIVIYKSSTGFTKKYAEMIVKELQCSIIDYESVTEKMLSEYNTVIFGSRAHAGMIDGYQKMKKLFQKSNINNLVLFVTGASPNAAEDIITEFWKQNLTADELLKIPHFYMQGGLCYEKMKFADKLMIKTYAAMLKKKKDKTPYEKEFEQAITSSYDISSKEYIAPLISYVKTYVKS